MNKFEGGNVETSYQQLHNQFPTGDGDETPQDAGFMIHVVPDGAKSRWNHIEDLDSFFTRVYQYHQKHGFTCMIMQEVLELVQFVFVVLFSTFLFQCVDYSILFRDDPVQRTKKTTLSETIKPLDTSLSELNGVLILCLVMALLFWILRAIRVVYNVILYSEIKQFYIHALKINEYDLDNLTWNEVQRKMQEVQKEQQMCIHKQALTELDIYHRILRFKNYMVAMVNKSLLPLQFNLPIIGEVVFLTKGLKYNIELILFWGPWAPFENNWHLKDDYKKANKRKELADLLSKRIFIIGVINFLLCPLVLIWQILYFFFNYAEVLKREPGSLGMRRWSMFGRIYLRHFNELDHELNGRMNRAYRLANKYMGIFTSHLLAVAAKNVVFFAGSILAVLVALSIYDEDVIQVEHVLSIMTILGFMVAGCRALIPDEHLVWAPERLMLSILAHIHYMPDSWKGNAHSTVVRDEFSQLFQYKAVYLIEELLSPLVTPIILCFYLRHKALDIVDFYRNFTVEVVGVGDVCSFAQMNVKRHGNAHWTGKTHAAANQYQQAEDGKTELSLVHFTLTNPDWKPPEMSTVFMTNLRENLQKDVAETTALRQEANNYLSLNTVSSVGGGIGCSNVVTSILRAPFQSSMQGVGNRFPGSANDRSMINRLSFKGGVSRTEGKLHPNNSGLLASIQSASGCSNSQGPESMIFSSDDLAGLVTNTSQFVNGGNDGQLMEYAAAEMSFSALYIHELHRRYQIQNSVDVRQQMAAPDSGDLDGCNPGPPAMSVNSCAPPDMPYISEEPEDDRKSERKPLLPR